MLRLLGTSPPRGPYVGGNRVIVQGAGFLEGATTLAVDGVMVREDQVTVTSTGMLSVVMPPHAPGLASMSVRVGDLSAQLSDAYQYDALAVEPAFASTDGGLRVSIRGSGVGFRAGDVLEFGGTACNELVIVSEDEANCRVPSGGASKVDVVLRRGSVALVTAPEAFEYIDTFFTTGSISGEAIAGSLEVSALGDSGPLANALVIVSGSPAGELRARTGISGTVVFSDPLLSGPVSVHVGHLCYSRTSVVGVNARILRIPLRLHHTAGTRPGCPMASENGLPPFLPAGRARALVQFLGGQEFPVPTREWTGVPDPRPGTRRALYVWSTAGPDIDESPFLRFLESDWDESRQGFVADLSSLSVAVSICAVAGIEPVSLPGPEECTIDNLGACVRDYERGLVFERFVVGCSPTVLVPPLGVSREVTIEMTGRLTDIAFITAAPLPSLAVPNSESPASTRSSLSAGASVVLEDFILFREVDYDGVTRQSSPFTPFTAQFFRLPAAPFAPPRGSELQAGVVWDHSVAIVRSLTDSAPIIPMGVPRFVAPTLRESIRFEIAGAIEPKLVQLEVLPNGYRLGGSIPAWYLFAAGGVREISLPDAPEDELRMAPALYQIDVTAKNFERFDFNSWTFIGIAQQSGGLHVSGNRVFARLNPGAP